MINLILCGGIGTRLWPLSRKLYPKQFIKFQDGQSPFQKTLIRNSKICEKIIISIQQEHYALALEQLAEAKNLTENHNEIEFSFLIESCIKNTAPAITLACLQIENSQEVLVTPSDHIINNELSYKKVTQRAQQLAQQGYLVTVGIHPTRAETGYGYIKAKNEDVLEFVEKPNAQRANQMINEGNYFWNAGIFCFNIQIFLDEIKEHSNAIYQASLNCSKQILTLSQNTQKFPFESMNQIPQDSIDYAVFEKSKKIKVIPAEIEWSDVGNFKELFRLYAKDENNNAVIQQNINIDSSNNLILNTDSKQFISTIGINNLAIINTEDALLVLDIEQGQKIKNLLEQLPEDKSHLKELHLTDYRPWGHYKVLYEDKNYKVKKITVNPHCKLSLQKHNRRKEHWTVVKGVATVTLDDDIFELNINESVDINKQQVHRLANNTDNDVDIIEVQLGEYLGEDDIIRLQDDYKRN